MHSSNTQILLMEKAGFVSLHYLSWHYKPLLIAPSTLPGMYSPASLITLSPPSFPSPHKSLRMLVMMTDSSLYFSSHFSGLIFTQLYLLHEHPLTTTFFFFGHVSWSLFLLHPPWCLGFLWCYFSVFFNALWPIVSYSNNCLLTTFILMFFNSTFL